MKRAFPPFIILLAVCLATIQAGELTPAKRAEYEKTVQIYTGSVIPSNPKDARSYVIRGSAYFALRELDLALADFSQAVHYAPGFGTHYRDRGEVYAAMEQYDKALGDYNQAIRLSPGIASTYVDRANTYWQLKQYAQAGEDYRQGVVLDPRDAYACRLFAWFLINCPEEKFRDEARAVQLAQRACSLSPKDQACMQILGDAQAALKQRTEQHPKYVRTAYTLNRNST